MAAKKKSTPKMQAPKAPAKKTAVGVKAPAKKMAAPAKSVSKKQNNSGGPGTSNPLKSGEEYLKPQGFMSGRNDKRTPKNTSGDLGSDRAAVRVAAQRNEILRDKAVGNINVTWRNKDGKLVNTVQARRDDFPFPKGSVFFLGDASPKKKKKK